MLMQMMSSGAMGGGVSSAIARALGSGRSADADATILHALLIATGFAAFFTVAVIGAGPWLYASLGGRGDSLSVALTYSNIVFSGVILIWLFNTLANVIRGTGNTFVPASSQCEGSDRAWRIAKPGAIGGLVGAGLGAAGGAIADGGKAAGKGALIGGALGAGGGTLYGIYDNKKNDESYRAAYGSCMKARGYTG